MLGGQLGALSLPISYAETNTSISNSVASDSKPVDSVKKDDSEKTSDVAQKELKSNSSEEASPRAQKELKSENSELSLSITSQLGFQLDDSLTASLSNSKEHHSYGQDIAKLSRQLRKEGRSLVDLRLVTVDAKTQQQEGLETRLDFKNGLALKGLSTGDKNVSLAVVSNNKLQLVKATVETGGTSQIKSVTYNADLGQRIIFATTRELRETEKLDLGSYGQLVIDGAVNKRDKTDSADRLGEAITVNILLPKKSAVESSRDSADFDLVQTIDTLYTWDNQFYVTDFSSTGYEIVKTDYQSAKDSVPRPLDTPFGVYQAEPSSSGANTVNLYLRSTLPLTLKPMLATPRGPQPRAFKTKVKRAAQLAEPKGELEHHKRIDYLGDGQNNPDTSLDDDSANKQDTSDLYRLYLDMTGSQQALDVLVVVDKSGSMRDGIGTVDKYRYYGYQWNSYYQSWSYYNTQDYDTFQGDSFDQGSIRYIYQSKVQVSSGIQRDQAVKDALLGDNGLLQKFININPKNSLSVIGFQGSIDYQSGKPYQKPNGTTGYQPSEETSLDADILKSWSQDATLDPDLLTGLDRNGTNYHAALLKADQMLQQVVGNGRRKIMVFISDGVPTFHFGPDHYREGNGTLLGDNVLNSQAGTKLAIDAFKQKYPDLTTYALGVSKDINSESASSSPVVLKYLSGEDRYHGISDTNELENTLNKIIEDSKASQLEISDTLSQYVNYYEQQPDVLVTRTSKETTVKEVLYQDNQVTEAGKNIIDKVTFTPKTTVQPSGKVTVSFKSDHKVDDKYTYTLSFNVKASDKAYEDYKDQKGVYATKGEADTDHAGNQTSSGKGGFYANQEASVNYKADGRDHKLPYKHPVIQVKPLPITFTKVDATDSSKLLEGVAFELRKADKKTVWEKGTTDAKGKLTFSYLQKGKTYYLYETKARLGYTLPENPWEVTVAKDGKLRVSHPIEGEVAPTAGAYQIKNHKLYQLPSSGGRGSQFFLLVGSLLMTVTFLLYRRRLKLKGTRC
ncbi:DUF7604 domain-containing protein [Streptococcus hongkongensis]